MIDIQGKFNTARCFVDEMEPTAAGQIKAVCDTGAFADCKIRIMPDVHAGLGCTIGTTMTITDKVVPGMVGVDIGCGMETVKLTEREIDFERLDHIAKYDIPSGYNIRETPHAYAGQIDLNELRCSPYVNLVRAERSIGTLGGGNHFIEVDRDEDGALYLIIHSGSRHLGKETAEYYGSEGFKALCGNARFQIDAKIKELKESGNSHEIHKTIKEMKKQRAMMTPLPKDLAYVEGQLFDDYIHDMKMVQRFAVLNRQAMVDIILQGMGWHEAERFITIHNYIDTDHMILRKGAVSAQAGEKLLIPLNMRDGSLICVGKGNEDWNCSAPHGAGRVLSRKSAREQLSVEEYAEQMEGIYTSCVGMRTIDEAPMAYKDGSMIERLIAPTAEIIRHLKPVYNYKAG